MTQEQLRMQMLAGIITEGQYKSMLKENVEEYNKIFSNWKVKEFSEEDTSSAFGPRGKVNWVMVYNGDKKLALNTEQEILWTSRVGEDELKYIMKPEDFNPGFGLQRPNTKVPSEFIEWFTDKYVPKSPEYNKIESSNKENYSWIKGNTRSSFLFGAVLKTTTSNPIMIKDSLGNYIEKK